MSFTKIVAGNFVLFVLSIHLLLMRILYRLEQMFPSEDVITIDCLSQSGGGLIKQHNKGLIPYSYLLRYGGLVTNNGKPYLLVDQVITNRMLLMKQAAVILSGIKTRPNYITIFDSISELASVSPTLSESKMRQRMRFCQMRSEFDWDIALATLCELGYMSVPEEIAIRDHIAALSKEIHDPCVLEKSLNEFVNQRRYKGA